MSVLSGLLGGLVATIVMTAVMMAVGEGGPPPTANLVAKFADGDPEDHAMPGMALHVLYGIGAGAVFAVALPLVVADPSLAVATGLGLVYGLVLMAAGMVFWLRLVIGIDPDPGMMKTFGVVHVVYGLVLGAFVGAGILA